MEALVCPHCDTSYQEDYRFCPGCGFSVEQLRSSFEDPFIGHTLPGGYVVMELVEIGGMGRIYRAEQRVLRRTVAVKIVHPHLLGDTTVEARFITEARAASQLNHPNSVSIIDFGKFEGGFYLVMEFLRGKDLATVAYEEGPLEIGRIIEIMCQILAALEEAHHLGIIHRDLKPENIFLESLRTGDDFVKVLDFGLAKLHEATIERRITDPGMVCGTPQYMAPEQARGETIDHRADLYACGVLLYELLTTQLPFEAPSPNQVVLMHLSQPPTDPREVVPDRHISQGLADIALKALAKEATSRFQTATELIDALRGVSVEASHSSLDAPETDECSACETMLARGQSFCSKCGEPQHRDDGRRGLRRTGETPLAPKPAPEPMVLTAREREIAWLIEQREQADTLLHAVRIVGLPGIGKTRLLNEYLARAKLSGDVVVRLGPDPWRARQGYYTLIEAIRALADLPRGGGESARWTGTTQEARAGLEWLFVQEIPEPLPISNRRWSESPPPRDVPDTSRRFVVAEALRWALSKAQSMMSDNSSRIVLAIDDLDVIDGASRNALSDVIAEPPLMGVLIIATHVPGFDPHWSNDETLDLKGLSTMQAASLVEAGERGLESRSASVLRVAREPNVLPLYVEQLLHFARAGGDVAPPGLADLIALRVKWLEADARRVLQAIVVLGDAVQVVQLAPLLPDITDLNGNLDSLHANGFVNWDNSDICVCHTLIREVVHASTPLEVRRRLHAQARRDMGAEELRIPLEAHAYHAYHAGQSFEALMLLEQVAARATLRHDLWGAVDALRRGLDLTREELARGHLDDPLGAMVMFSCKLGDMLVLTGKYTDAEGVLKEALSLVGPSLAERPRILASLANVATSSGQIALAEELWNDALRLAVENDRDDLINTLHLMRRAWQRR